VKKIKVIDKETFRLWCSEMKLNTKQASAVLGISRPQVYKYISDSTEHDVSETVKIICELLNLLSHSELVFFISQKLTEKNCTEQWPSEKPVAKPQNK